MANCRVFSCSPSFSLFLPLYLSPPPISLSLLYRDALLVSSSRDICPRAHEPLSLLRSLLSATLVSLSIRNSQITDCRSASPVKLSGKFRSAGAYTDMASGYTRDSLAAIEIIPVDTHARRLIALGFDAPPSANEATVIRSTKRQTAVSLS